MSVKALAMVTDSERFRAPPPSDTILASALAAAGWIVRRVDWRQKQRWSSYRAALPRSTWDYKHQPTEFLNWVDDVAAQTRLINSAKTIRWNIDKRYLEDLRSKGIPCLQSLYGTATEISALTGEAESLGWRELVIKPAISAGGDEMTRIKLTELDDEQIAALQKRYEASGNLVFQPFYETVLSFGELSLILFDGQPSHALHKTAASGEYRVQEEYQGSTQVIEARPEVWAQAEAVIEAATAQLGERPLISRVDFLLGAGGLELSELELIEPSLYLEHSPEAAKTLARMLTERLVECGEDLHCATCTPS